MFILVKIYEKFAGQYLAEVKVLQLYPRYVTPRRLHKGSKMKKHAKISKYRTMQKQATEHQKIKNIHRRNSCSYIEKRLRRT